MRTLRSKRSRQGRKVGASLQRIDGINNSVCSGAAECPRGVTTELGFDFGAGQRALGTTAVDRLVVLHNAATVQMHAQASAKPLWIFGGGIFAVAGARRERAHRRIADRIRREVVKVNVPTHQMMATV